MSPSTVRVLPAAEAEAAEAFLWYRERSSMAADAFRAELLAAIDSLATTAHRWPQDGDGVRHLHLRRFPYTVMFDVSGSVVTVLAVAHQRRRPGYWKPAQR